MQDHPSSEQLNQYQRHILAPDVFLSIQKHIDSCSECFRQTNLGGKNKDDHETLLAALIPDPLEEPYHLTTAELGEYINNTLADLDIEAIESHLAVCTRCERAVKELRATQPYDSFVGPQKPAPGEKVHAQIREYPAPYFQAWRRPVQVAALLTLVLGLIVITAILILRRAPIDRNHSVNANIQNIPSQSSANANANEGASGSSPRPVPSQTQSESGSTGSTSNSATIDSVSTQQEGIAKLSPHLREAINSALTTQTLEKPKVLANLTGNAGTLLGESEHQPQFRLLSPVGLVVRKRNPTLHWQALAGATSYIVTVADDKLNVVVRSNSITNPEWTVPILLERGRIYLWQVTAIREGQSITSPVMPTPQARFKILDQVHEQELVSAKRNVPNYHLGLGILYARVGLLEEAEKEFQAELQVRPHAVIAQKMLQSVRSMKE